MAIEHEPTRHRSQTTENCMPCIALATGCIWTRKKKICAWLSELLHHNAVKEGLRANEQQIDSSLLPMTKQIRPSINTRRVS